MSIESTIITGYQQREHGQEVADLRAYAEALAAEEHQLRVQQALKDAQGGTSYQLRKIVAGELPETPGLDEKAEGLPREDVVRALELKEGGQGVADPGQVAAEIRREFERVMAEQEGEPAYAELPEEGADEGATGRERAEPVTPAGNVPGRGSSGGSPGSAPASGPSSSASQGTAA